MKKIILFTLLLAGFALPLLSGESPKASQTKNLSPWQNIQSEHCAYRLRCPRGSRLERPGDCVLKIILPSKKGQEWIQEASLTLEVSAAEKGEATENPVDGEAPTRSLTAGGLKFSKTSEEDAAAGHRYVTVSYTAIGKKHQYHFVGILSATNPEVMGTPVPHWNAQKSAEKIFDGIILSFRPLE